MKINQALVEKAINVLSEWQGNYKNGFPKEMKGDISSFGASIVQAGLLPSVLFFSEGDLTKKAQNADDGTKIRRARVMQMIFETMGKTATHEQKRPLFDFVRLNLNKTDVLNDITEAALALKLAFRAFHFDEKSDKPSPKTNE
jgi:CRISPR-associated protein Cmr5